MGAYAPGDFAFYDSILNSHRMARCFPLFWRWQIQISTWSMGDQPPDDIYWQTIKYNLSKDDATAELVRLKLDGQKVVA